MKVVAPKAYRNRNRDILAAKHAYNQYWSSIGEQRKSYFPEDADLEPMNTDRPSPIPSDFLGCFHREDGIWIRFSRPMGTPIEARIKQEDMVGFQEQMEDTEGELDISML